MNVPVTNDLGKGATDMVSAGLQLLQIRTEKQLMIAVQRPRDLDKFENALKREAAAAGEDFYYHMEFKDHVQGCSRRGCKCPVGEIVEGPGVGLARSAARLWGNCAVETFPESEDATAWQTRTTFVDFETNYMKSETKRVSKMKVTRGGGYRKASDKELDMIYQIGASKVERDCIIRSLPKYIIDTCWQLAKAADAQSKQPIREQVARLLAKFSELHVTLKMIEDYLGCAFSEEGMKKAEKNPAETCAQLRGLLTALRSGDTTVDEIFAGEKSASQATAATGSTGAVKPDDVLKGAAVAEATVVEADPFTCAKHNYRGVDLPCPICEQEKAPKQSAKSAPKKATEEGDQEDMYS